MRRHEWQWRWGRSGAVFGQQIQSWAVDLTHLAAPSGRTSRIFLATLLPEQWERPTLCDCWRMRDVVAHLISYDELDIPGLLRRLAVGRLSLNRANAAGVAEYATASSEELLGVLRNHLQPHGLPARFGGRIALVDGLIYHQDIRRPLGQHSRRRRGSRPSSAVVL